MADRTHVKATLSNKGQTVELKAWLTIDQVEGVIRLEPMKGGRRKWVMTFRPENVDSFKIEQVEDADRFVRVGSFTNIIFMLMVPWLKVPVVKLSQSVPEVGQQTVQFRGSNWWGGNDLLWFGRKATRTIAKRIAAFLQERGYRDLMPAELDNDDVWKAPIGAILVYVALFIALVVFLTIIRELSSVW
jgi:hypothetical protein